MTTQIRRVLGVAVLAAATSLAAGCAGTSGGTTSSPDARGDFGSEGRDPGMGDRGGTSGGAANIDGSFRTVYFDFDDYGLSGEAKNGLRHNAALRFRKSHPTVRAPSVGWEFVKRVGEVSDLAALD